MAPAAALAAVGRDVDGPVAGEHHAGDPGTVGGAQDGAEVPRVGHAVDQYEERRALPARAGQVVEVGLGQRCRLGQHSLGCLAASFGVQAPPAHALNGHPQVGGESEDLRGAATVVPLAATLGLGGHPQLAHLPPARQQQLPYGLAAFDLLAAEALRRRGPPPGSVRGGATGRAPGRSPGAPGSWRSGRSGHGAGTYCR